MTHRIAHAFTLIELLVVIAIIAVLSAILFPVFTQAKSASKTSVCLSNMKQFGVATALYLIDYNDRFYPAATYSPLAGFADQQLWVGIDNNNSPIAGGFLGDATLPATHPIRPGLIDPYLKDGAIKQCPSRPLGAQTALALNGFRTNYASDYYTTNPIALNSEFGPSAMNALLVGGVLQFEGATGTEIQQPAITLLMWEHTANVPICNFLQKYDWFLGPPDNDDLRAHFNFLHNGGTNTLWADFHAKRMVYGQLKRPYFSVRKDIYPPGSY